MDKKNIFVVRALSFLAFIVIAVMIFSNSKEQPSVVSARTVDNLSGFAWSDMPTCSDEDNSATSSNSCLTGDAAVVNATSGEGYIGHGVGWISFNSQDYIKLCSYRSVKFGTRTFYYSGGTSTPGCLPKNQVIQDNYGVNVGADGVITGYAWANPRDESDFTSPFNSSTIRTRVNNIGWIAFSTSSAATGCPGNSPEGDCLARFDRQTGEIVGWARAIQGANVNRPVAVGVGTSSMTGGWDGWISLSSGNENASVPDADYGVQAIGCNWEGWAWGSDVLGWISFNGATGGGGNYKVEGTDTPSCAVLPTLRIAPTSVTLILGEKNAQQLNAWFDPDGPDEPKPEIDVTASSTWTSADPSKVQADPVQPGLIIGIDRGQGITITATYPYRAGRLIARASSSIDVNVLPHSHIKEIPPQ